MARLFFPEKRRWPLSTLFEVEWSLLKLREAHSNRRPTARFLGMNVLL